MMISKADVLEIKSLITNGYPETAASQIDALVDRLEELEQVNKEFAEKAAARSEEMVAIRSRNPGVTVFDTGEMLEPKVWSDGSGSVGFDNDESATEITVNAYPSLVEPDTIVVDIDSHAASRLKVTVNDGIVFIGSVQ